MALPKWNNPRTKVDKPMNQSRPSYDLNHDTPHKHTHRTVINCFCNPSRAEKERSQYFSEVNDLRAGLDHVSNEKVLKQKQRPAGLRFAFARIENTTHETRQITTQITTHPNPKEAKSALI